MTEAELGKATILYEDPNEGTVEETVDNEYVAYFQDHWIIKTGEHEDGKDIVRRIPATRVYYVERNVEEFEAEVKTLRDQVQSMASDLGGEMQTLRSRIESVAGGIQRQRRGGSGQEKSSESEAQPIEIEVGEGVERTSTDASDVVEDDASSSETDDEDVDRSL